ncbi:MAG: cell division protein ZapA [Oscillospiraceae bacterium]|nr:cell division protein ZapA [Oscillospiraceae bacterium]
MLNRIKVVICGKEYSLQTEEQPSYVYNLARYLENQINDMVQANEGVSTYSAAVMIALSALDDVNKANESIDNIRTQIKDYVDDAGKARMERDDALREIEMLRVKIQRLENEIKLKKLKENM